MRKQVFTNSVLQSDNIDDFPASEWRQKKYDAIRSFRDKLMEEASKDEQRERDAADTGNEPDTSKVIAIQQARHVIWGKAKAAKLAVDALGSDKNAIHSFNVEAAFA